MDPCRGLHPACSLVASRVALERAGAVFALQGRNSLPDYLGFVAVMFQLFHIPFAIVLSIVEKWGRLKLLLLVVVYIKSKTQKNEKGRGKQEGKGEGIGKDRRK